MASNGTVVSNRYFFAKNICLMYWFGVFTCKILRSHWILFREDSESAGFWRKTREFDWSVCVHENIRNHPKISSISQNNPKYTKSTGYAFFFSTYHIPTYPSKGHLSFCAQAWWDGYGRKMRRKRRIETAKPGCQPEMIVFIMDAAGRL